MTSTTVPYDYNRLNEVTTLAANFVADNGYAYSPGYRLEYTPEFQRAEQEAAKLCVGTYRVEGVVYANYYGPSLNDEKGKADRFTMSLGSGFTALTEGKLTLDPGTNLTVGFEKLLVTEPGTRYADRKQVMYRVALEHRTRTGWNGKVEDRYCAVFYNGDEEVFCKFLTWFADRAEDKFERTLDKFSTLFDLDRSLRT